MSSNKKSIENRIEEIQAIPIVAILGHVDHGKTSLLDYIRSTNVQLKEVGGITQKISVFTVESDEGKRLTFIDTPGHEAFDLMRLRGGKVADVVLLIVAADDGIKPQTVESIEIIKNSTVKPIVVITKKDLGLDNINKIKRDLANKGLLVEGMGGNIPVVETSTKSGEGINELLEVINLLVEVEGLKEVEQLPKDVYGKAYTLESVKDKSKGFVVSVVVTEGNFEIGDYFAYKVGDEIFLEKIKAFITEEGVSIEKLSKGFGGKIIGLSNLVDLGIEGYCLKKKEEKLAKSLFPVEETTFEEEKPLEDEELLEDFFKDVKKEENDTKVFKVIIKASSEGCLEAIKQSVDKIDVEGLKIDIVHSGIGNISLRDVDTALVTKSIILGFEVSFEKGVEDFAKKNKVFVRTYDIIYKLIDEIKDAGMALVEPEEVEDEIGSAEVKEIFTLSDGSKVIGCRGREGIIKRGEKAYFVRDDEIISEGKIVSMKHNKNDIKEAGKNDEFGVIINNSVDELLPGDILYCFKVLK
jgi:translation initiation factor IF-2